MIHRVDRSQTQANGKLRKEWGKEKKKSEEEVGRRKKERKEGRKEGRRRRGIIKKEEIGKRGGWTLSATPKLSPPSAYHRAHLCQAPREWQKNQRPCSSSLDMLC